MHDYAESLLDEMTPQERRQWLDFAAVVEVKEFARDGKRLIRLTHRPTGKAITKVRGADWRESYLDAFDALMDEVRGPEG